MSEDLDYKHSSASINNESLPKIKHKHGLMIVLSVFLIVVVMFVLFFSFYIINQQNNLAVYVNEAIQQAQKVDTIANATEEEKIYYYKYNLNSGCFASEEQGLKSSYNFVKFLPLPILRFAGNLLYRHIG